ncbi:hypothetical protein J6590_081662 [Homalodisca vitripennis]|nr:hypothetical protein J6590_081662 [Homalodisca vitripennis]
MYTINLCDWPSVKPTLFVNFLTSSESLKNYQIPEHYWTTFQDLVKSVEQVSPTPQLQQFVKSAADYFEKFVKQQPFDKAEALKQLLNELTAALDSLAPILKELAQEFSGKTSPGSPPKLLLTPPSFGSFVAPPGTARFSLLNWIKSPDLPTLSELYYTYRPKNSPIDILPPFDASAQLIGGTEFFTFDRKHYSFKGSCSYILSTDVIDGNFTLVANMEAGKLKSIAAFDHDNSIELLNDNKVLVNGKPADLPAKAGDLHMWRNFYSGTGFATWSGIMFYCTSHLQSCAFSIDGFYFGKTRGLLGTYNNEPYDDAIIPEGSVGSSTAMFANSWKVNPQCADGVVHEQPAPAAPQCTKLFSGGSSLRGCFAYANPESFREACNKQVAEASGEAKEEAACNIALSYVGYCYYVHFVLIPLPDHCGKCQVGSETLHIGESASVKTPQTAADVVIVVEQLEDNEDIFNNLISPLVSTLRNDFKEKGIVDVNFALIGYGAPDQQWLSVYTFNGEFNKFSGSAENIYFGKEQEISKPKLSDKLQEIKKILLNEIGFSKPAQAFQTAFNYPFRPEALKTIVGVMSSGCDSAILPFQTMRLLVHRINLLNSGVVLNMVTPLKDLSVDGKDEKVAANIVGFDSDAVYTQGEAKRKVLRGDEEALHKLKYTSDLCIELTLGTNGAVFSSSNFVKGKPNLRKNFLQVLSNKITDSLTREELVNDCKCELERGMITKTKCTVTSRREKEPLARNIKGVKG